MDEADAEAGIFPGKVVGHVLSAVNRTVLTACAAEADHKAIESALHVCLHMRIHYPIGMLKETEHLTVVLKESYYRLVSSGQFLIWFISSRIVDRPAVEHVSSAVAGRVIWYSFLEREAAYLDFKHTFFRNTFLESRQRDKTL